MAIYRPRFRSQMRDPNSTPLEFKLANCGFSAGACALERHTRGDVSVTTQDLREFANPGVSNRPVGIRPGALNPAWKRAIAASDYAAKWATAQLEVPLSDGFDTFFEKVRSGRGAIICGTHQVIPAQYNCNCTKKAARGNYECFRGNHYWYVNEVRPNGDMLVYDSSCDTQDKVPSYWDDSALDPMYAHLQTEAQPKWIPAEYVRKYGESYVSNKNKLVVAYTRITEPVEGGTPGSGSAGNLVTGDVFMVYTPGNWEQITRMPSSPGEPAILERIYDQGQKVEGFINMGNDLVVASAEQVIMGEEGRVSDWSPTAHGYGVKGRAHYTAQSRMGVKWTFKTPEDAWYFQPWDKSPDYFHYRDPLTGGAPPWPEGAAALLEMLTKHNRATGAQSLSVVNRANLWEQIELGGYYTLDLDLIGAYPSGLRGTVRVVGFSPDEDAGEMQLLCEWIGFSDPTDDEVPGDDDPREQGGVASLGDPDLFFYTQRVDGRPFVNCFPYATCTTVAWSGHSTPADFGMTIRRASGIPVAPKKGMNFADILRSLRALDITNISVETATNDDLIAMLPVNGTAGTGKSVVTVVARMDKLPRHLRRLVGLDWEGWHAIAIGATKLEGSSRYVWWMDPMGKPSTGYAGEWALWNDVKNTLRRLPEGIRIVRGIKDSA
jgi:hypothetical protein